MILNILQIICLINYGFTLPNDLFDEFWQTNQSGPQANSIDSQPKIKKEPHEEQYGRCQDLKETLKIKHEPHYGAVNVEETVNIKHESHSEDVTVKSEQIDESQKGFIKVKVEEVGPSVEEHGQKLLTSTSVKTKDGAQTSMAPKRQLPIVLDSQTSVSVEDEHESLKMISPLSKSARRNRARSKMPQNESAEEDNCSEEPDEAYNHTSSETFEESDYSESEDFKEIDNKNDQQNFGKRIHYTEEEKLEIVNKFLKMKQNLYNSGDKRPYQEINKEIADKLNPPSDAFAKILAIYYSEKEKREIVNKFLKLKYELNNNNKKGKRPYREINNEIADKLNVHIRTIYKWKKNFDHKIIHSEEEKLEIVNKFLKMKQELCNNGDKRLCKEIDKELADKFGVTIGTICKWIKKFGFSTLKRFTSEQKIELVKRIEKLKKENPKLKKKEIAKKLQISCTYLNQLIKQIPLEAAKQRMLCLNKMEEFWMLFLVLLFATNTLDKAESVKVKLEEMPLKTFDEIFGEGWWDKDEAEDLKMPAPTNFGQNVHHQIDRQNTQIGHIEPNSTDQLGQIEPNSTDQNASLTESDHSENAKNGEEQNEKIAEDERKRKIIEKFHAMKDEFKQKGKFSVKEWVQIDGKIAKHLKVNRSKIYKWKKEFGLSQINPKNERKHLVEKFDQMKAELTRDGFKNSYPNQINETVAKELGLSFKTIYKWKRKLGQSKPSHKHPHSVQKELMKRYYEIKDENPKNSDGDIAKMLTIGARTLTRWKSQFKRQQFHPNSVEKNAAANLLQEIVHSNSGSS